MGKRYILAIALSFIILLAWSALVKKQYPVANKEVAASNIKSSAVVIPTPTPQQAIEQLPSVELRVIEHTKGNEKIIFTEENAAIREIIFNQHQQHRFPLKYGFAIDDPSLQFKEMSSLDISNLDSSSKMSNLENKIRFVHSGKDKKIAKDFIFSNEQEYDFWLRIHLQNVSSETQNISLPIILGVLDFTPNNLNNRFLGVVLKTKDQIFHLNGRKEVTEEAIEFIALRDKYFCALIEPESTGCSAYIRKLDARESEVGLICEKIMLAPGEHTEKKFHIYLGPQDVRLMNNIKPAWAAVIHYGMFDFISQILLQMLAFFYALVHNWGWAIIILSVVVYLILFPLTLKQMKSMKEMQALQPRIEELRKTYKDNPQKLNKEIMELYREHKVNPFGGCLPLILQMPIFFGLYQALMRSVALKGAKFLWIKDLSEPDRLFMLPNSLPILGNEINILPIIMAIGMFFQQKLSMVPAGGSSAEQQKMMMIIFPIMFGLIFYRMPSGLVLYWFINSALMTAYQFYIRRAK